MSLDAETPHIPASPEYFNDHEPQRRMSTPPVCRQTWLKADLMGPVREDGLNVRSYGQGLIHPPLVTPCLVAGMRSAWALVQ